MARKRKKRKSIRTQINKALRNAEKREWRNITRLPSKLLLLEKHLNDLERDDVSFAKSLIQYYQKNERLTEKQLPYVDILLQRANVETIKSRSNRTHYLYLISDGEYVKIGYSTNPKSRLNDMQVGRAEKLKLVASVECENRQKAKKEERLAHQACKDLRIRGEWFKIEAMHWFKEYYEIEL